MNIFRFRDRVGVLDERSQRFLTTVAWLGGYVTPEQAQELGMRNSTTRVHVQLNDLESWGFIKRVAAYPAIYQITKSVTRLLRADLSARRQHAIETIQTRLLTVHFYLEATRWPLEFVFDHQQKISKIGKIVAAAKEPYSTMFAVLGMTGLRAGEMLGLKVSDLDFTRKVIHVRRSIDSRTRQEQTPKSRGSASDVPMPAALEKRLLEFLRVGYRENLNGYLFANRNGNPYSIGKVTEYGLWPALEKLKIERAGLHAFRHAAASELLEQGAPLTVVQRQLRHRDARTTLQKYGHVVGDAQRRAVETLAENIERYAVVELEPSAEMESSVA